MHYFGVLLNSHNYASILSWNRKSIALSVLEYDEQRFREGRIMSSEKYCIAYIEWLYYLGLQSNSLVRAETCTAELLFQFYLGKSSCSLFGVKGLSVIQTSPFSPLSYCVILCLLALVHKSKQFYNKRGIAT